jgi:hypothetical protein
VDYARGPKAFGVPGKLRVAVEYTQGADGGRIPLRGEQYKRGAGNAAVTVLFMPFAGFWMKGKNPVIEEGTILKAYVDWPDPADQSAGAPGKAARAAAPAAPVSERSDAPRGRIPTR